MSIQSIMCIDLVKKLIMSFAYPTKQLMAEYRKEHMKRSYNRAYLLSLDKTPICSWCRIVSYINLRQHVSEKRKRLIRKNTERLLKTRIPVYYKRLGKFYIDMGYHNCNSAMTTRVHPQSSWD